LLYLKEQTNYNGSGVNQSPSEYLTCTTHRNVPNAASDNISKNTSCIQSQF